MLAALLWEEGGVVVMDATSIVSYSTQAAHLSVEHQKCNTLRLFRSPVRSLSPVASTARYRHASTLSLYRQLPSSPMTALLSSYSTRATCTLADSYPTQ